MMRAVAASWAFEMALLCRRISGCGRRVGNLVKHRGDVNAIDS